MKSAIVLISSLLLLVLPLTAQADDDGRGVLFLTSEPIHAAVYLDGEPQPETTPLVLRNLTAGSHDIIIVKEGYLPYEGSVEIPQGGSPATYHTVLTFPFFRSRILDEEEIVLNDEPLEKREEESPFEVLLPTGLYQLHRESHRLLIETRYPRESLLRGVDFALLTTLLFAGGITANQLLLDSPSGLLTSPLVLTSYGGTLLLTALDVGLRIQRRRFFRDWAPPPPIQRGELSARDYFRRGERYFAMGRLPEAYQAFGAIPRDYPESALLPLALHRLSRINVLNGNILLAQEGYERLLKEYPHPEIYDRTCQSLAQLYARQEKWDKALFFLEQIVFLDHRLSREEVEEQMQTYRARLEEES